MPSSLRPLARSVAMFGLGETSNDLERSAYEGAYYLLTNLVNPRPLSPSSSHVNSTLTFTGAPLHARICTAKGYWFQRVSRGQSTPPHACTGADLERPLHERLLGFCVYL